MTLYLVGGGPTEAVGPIIDDFLAAVRHRGQRIAIAILGEAEDDLLAIYAAPIKERFPQAEIEPVWLADETAIKWPEDPQGLAGLIVAGGWIPGYLEALMPAKATISQLVRSGVPYLGWSAGAAIVGRYVIAGGWQYQGRRIAPEIAGEGSTELDIREGLALIGPSIEAHADTKYLVGRALAALQVGKMKTVAAIDEKTALVVDANSGSTQVIGVGKVAWVSRNEGQFVISYQPN